MRIRLPSKRIRERFLLVYELEGCQKAVDFLTKYYGVRRMKIRLDGRKVGNNCVAYYFQNRAYFTKRGLNKRTILHEVYHHLIYVNGLGMTAKREERAANSYSKAFMSRHSASHARALYTSSTRADSTRLLQPPRITIGRVTNT